MHLCWRVFGSVPQARRSGGRNSADQVVRVARLVQDAPAGRPSMSRRPYLRQMPRGWWLRQPRYTAYMVRELTSLFIALYSVFLVLGLVRLAQGSAAWDDFLAA